MVQAAEYVATRCGMTGVCAFKGPRAEQIAAVHIATECWTAGRALSSPRGCRGRASTSPHARSAAPGAGRLSRGRTRCRRQPSDTSHWAICGCAASQWPQPSWRAGWHRVIGIHFFVSDLQPRILTILLAEHVLQILTADCVLLVHKVTWIERYTYVSLRLHI